ncbi:MAG TPA: hypothetical protein VG674_31930 [Amycolatopsis sp.]|nr:hypothetical protein [Amycolatopsis sp.]
MTADPQRNVAALARLQDYRMRSLRWRSEHPAQATAPPGGVPTAARRGADRDELDRLDAAMQALGVPQPKLTAPLASTLRHAVEGELREQLLAWLPLVTSFWAPDGELAALGDATSHDAARLRQVLADEGFEHVLDVELDGRHRVQLWVHRSDGLLAEVNDTRGPGGDWVTENVRVRGCVEVVDLELLLAGTVGTNPVHIRGEDVATRFATVRLSVHLARPRRSLRVGLAVLRVAARPALPWPTPGVDGWIGPDSLNAASPAGLEETRPASVVASGTALFGLPADVHDLFGPNLLA